MQAAAEALLKPKKPTMTSRLSSMFGSSKDAGTKQSNGDVVKAARVPNGVDTANGRPTPVRQGSVSKAPKEPQPYKRFWANDEGGL